MELRLRRNTFNQLLMIDGSNQFVMVMVIIGLALVSGLLIGKIGILAVPVLVGGLLVPVLALRIGYKFFAYALFAILTGYQFGGKGFAYLGYNPIFISELVLLLGILTVILMPFSSKIKLANRKLSWVFIPMFMWMAWSAFRTAPYVAQYQLDAIRDAMLYIYALYAFLILILIPREMVEHFVNLYGRILPIFVFCGPLIFIITKFHIMPRMPGSPVPLIFQKSGDMGVHLGGAAAFMLLRLDKFDRPYRQNLLWMMWLVWSIAWLTFGSINRGGLVSASAAIGVAMLLRPNGGWYRPLTLGVVVICFMLVTGTYSTLRINLGGNREISAEQIVNNFASVIGSGNDEAGNLENTKEWRITWWNKIIDYTFFGDYFWTGKGYGVNLVISDGAYSEANAEAKGTRSPHNGFMTILARSGVPGLMLWLVFLVAFLGTLLWNAVPIKKYNLSSEQMRLSKIAAWLLAYACAHLMNANVDVFLEGPMGGIWFWSLVGMSLVIFVARPKANDDQANQALHYPNAI